MEGTARPRWQCFAGARVSLSLSLSLARRSDGVDWCGVSCLSRFWELCLLVESASPAAAAVDTHGAKAGRLCLGAERSSRGESISQSISLSHSVSQFGSARDSERRLETHTFFLDGQDCLCSVPTFSVSIYGSPKSNSWRASMAPWNSLGTKRSREWPALLYCVRITSTVLYIYRYRYISISSLCTWWRYSYVRGDKT